MKSGIESSQIKSLIEEYHQMLDDFSRGNPQSAKIMYSRQDDITLANPFGVIATGWKQVSEALDYASSRFREGEVKEIKLVSKYESSEHLTIFEVEKWKSKVAGEDRLSQFELRVTSTFRLEGKDWKLVHRHADPISSFSEKGPLRSEH